MTRSLVLVLLSLASLLSARVSCALVDASWIYTVEQPVEAQSQEERTRAAHDGLLIVLSRVSGLASVPRHEAVRAALEAPERYYNEFVFFDKREPGGPRRPHVRITFEAREVVALARAADLPIWWTQRPQVLAWVAIDGDGPRRLIGMEEGGAFVEAIRAEANRRGLPLALPRLEPEVPEEPPASDAADGDTVAEVPEPPADRLATPVFIEPTPIESGDVWRRDETVLEPATLDRQGELFVAARLRVSQGDFGATLAPDDPAAADVLLSGDWRLWMDGREVTERFTDVPVAEAAMVGVALVANVLAETYAVLPRTRQALDVRIDGVDDIARYADLMRYLETLEYLERVQVTGMRASTLNVGVLTRAEVGQLFMLLNAGERLVEPDVAEALDAAEELREEAGSASLRDALGADEPTNLFDLRTTSPRHLDDALHLVWRG